MKKLFIIILLILISTVQIYAEETNKDLSDLQKLYDAGYLDIEEYKKAKKIITNLKYKKNLKKEKKITKKEPSQTQKILKSDKTLVNLVFCHEDFVSSFSTASIKTKLRLDNCKKNEYQVNWVDFINNWKIICYNKSDDPVQKIFQINDDSCNRFSENIVTINYDGEFFYYGKGKALNYVSNPNIVKSKTQIAKVEEPKQEEFKPKKTNKQSKTKITKKIIKTEVQDRKVKDISTWEKNVLAAIEKEKKDPYCEIRDKKVSILNLVGDFKKGKNYCIKKSDLLKLGQYKQFNTPNYILDKTKGCKTINCIYSKSGKKVYEIFVRRGPVYHARYPGTMIEGMVWFEILYHSKLKSAQYIFKKYDDSLYQDGLIKFKKKAHERKIYSLIKLNNGRIKMRKALGFKLYDDLYEVIEGQWLLAEFLNKDKLKASKVKMSPEMLKRKLLIEKYKTVLVKYKKKLDEEKQKIR